MTEEVQAILDRIPEAWGKWLSVPDHWLPRLVRLNRALADVYPDYEIHQVKEKFGGLRYYIGQPADDPNLTWDIYDQMETLIRQAEIDIDNLQRT